MNPENQPLAPNESTPVNESVQYQVIELAGLGANDKAMIPETQSITDEHFTIVISGEGLYSTFTINNGQIITEKSQAVDEKRLHDDTQLHEQRLAAVKTRFQN